MYPMSNGQALQNFKPGRKIPTFTFEQDPSACRMGNGQDLMQGTRQEGTAGLQWNFIVIWTKLMAVEWREKGNEEIFRKCNQMYWGIAWIQMGVKGEGVVQKYYS